MTTPTETKALVERLRALAEKATPGPWATRKHKLQDFERHGPIYEIGAAKEYLNGDAVLSSVSVFGPDEEFLGDTPIVQAIGPDAEESSLLIVALRNALPQILAALEPLTREPDADEVERGEAALLGFVTRMVWRKPEMSDHEIVEAIRFHPDVHDNMLAWGRYAEDHNDELLRTKLAQVAAKRKAALPRRDAMREALIEIEGWTLDNGTRDPRAALVGIKRIVRAALTEEPSHGG